MPGDEFLQKRAGANEPNRSRELQIVDTIRARAKSVVLSTDAAEIELVPPPKPDNRGRAVVALAWDGSAECTFGAAAAESGSSFEGWVYFIDETGERFKLAEIFASDVDMEQTGAQGFTPGLLFCLLHNEKLVFVPKAGSSPGQRGLFLPVYQDTDAIALRVPIPSTSDVVVVEGPPGKVVGFPSAKGLGAGPVSFSLARTTPTSQVDVNLYFEDAEGNRVFMYSVQVPNNSDEGGTANENFEGGVITLGPGEKIIAVAQEEPPARLVALTTIALLNATD